MKVGITTFHFVNNFGGALQACALRRVVEEHCGAGCVILDYRQPFVRMTDAVRILPISRNTATIRAGLATMGERRGRIAKFRAFREQHLSLVPTGTACDKYICGSDQIWNPDITLGVVPQYFLDFVKEPEKKIAYAPSFGSDRIAPRYRKKIGSYLNRIGSLSAREQSGVELIRELTGREAKRLIDPTFLLNREQWDQIIAKPAAPSTEEPYILLYIMQENDAVYETAKRLKEETGCRIIEISRYGLRPDFVDESRIAVGPDEFAALIRDAAYVCTNSFHGMAFSLIFERPFALVPSVRFRAREEELMELLKIRQGDLLAEYDPARTREIVAIERKRAISYLQEAVGN